ncbi:unnamed protein product [Citrullus colocynthis]|uniref:Uncharacterized protein n=1 Tax=Citrullus colocynthis TaxID=252529 RepID=A0ABP0XZD5_9ROSI
MCVRKEVGEIYGWTLSATGTWAAVAVAENVVAFSSSLLAVHIDRGKVTAVAAEEEEQSLCDKGKAVGEDCHGKKCGAVYAWKSVRKIKDKGHYEGVTRKYEAWDANRRKTMFFNLSSSYLFLS